MESRPGSWARDVAHTGVTRNRKPTFPVYAPESVGWIL